MLLPERLIPKEMIPTPYSNHLLEDSDLTCFTSSKDIR